MASRGEVPGRGMRAGLRRLGGGRSAAAPEPMRDPRAKRAAAVNMVEHSAQSGPPLTRVRAALPEMRRMAAAYATQIVAVNGGRVNDPTTRTERLVPPDPNLTPEGRAAKLTSLRGDVESALNARMAQAAADLNVVMQTWPSVAPLGRDLQLPGNRSDELRTVTELLRLATFAQWRNLKARAVSTDDRPLAEVVAFVARARASEWAADAADLEAELADLESAFDTPSTLAASYASAVASGLHAGLMLAASVFSHPEPLEQFSAYDAAGSFMAFNAPAADADYPSLFDAVVQSAVSPASADGLWVLDSSGRTPRLIPGRSSEAAGPARTVAESGRGGL